MASRSLNPASLIWISRKNSLDTSILRAQPVRLVPLYPSLNVYTWTHNRTDLKEPSANVTLADSTVRTCLLRSRVSEELRTVERSIPCLHTADSSSSGASTPYSGIRSGRTQFQFQKIQPLSACRARAR